nr:helix-turn-helix transcriptional regulator [Mesobacillus harenae]
MIGKQLQYIRQALNLSQNEMAYALDLTLITVWRIETGRQKPLPKTIRHIQEVLCYDEEDLIEINELLAESENSRRHARLKKKLREQANL